MKQAANKHRDFKALALALHAIYTTTNERTDNRRKALDTLAAEQKFATTAGMLSSFASHARKHEMSSADYRKAAAEGTLPKHISFVPKPVVSKGTNQSSPISTRRKLLIRPWTQQNLQLEIPA
ncbi:hypothetical protein DV711_06290 [Motiliproteus coralliicola]|uniref:Uncharacterized protein n=1 Tax=Motiliproteus coralliicola TaxID=2283196 RepID=A0A369WU09_9GAMM|nr:hypothetical protein [Motiliproteus coralliicola]RDE25162.1 hypothetical protein DV711_06290 [Motiliproteus coralliicola]